MFLKLSLEIIFGVQVQNKDSPGEVGVLETHCSSWKLVDLCIWGWDAIKGTRTCSGLRCCGQGLPKPLHAVTKKYLSWKLVLNPAMLINLFFHWNEITVALFIDGLFCTMKKASSFWWRWTWVSVLWSSFWNSSYSGCRSASCLGSSTLILLVFKDRWVLE